MHTSVSDDDAIALPTTGTHPHLQLAADPPGLCVLHGQEAVRRAPVRILLPHKVTDDLPRNASGFFLSGGNPVWTALANVQRRLATGPVVHTSWPLCRRCARRRGIGLYGGGALAASAVVLIGLSVVLALMDTTGPTATAMLVAGVTSLPVTVALLHTTRPAKLLRATAAPDGSAVIVTDPHPDFAAALRAAER